MDTTRRDRINTERGFKVLIMDINETDGLEEFRTVLNRAAGKVIAALTLVDDCLDCTFTDGTKIRFSDNGQSCCESRYMRTDDTLSEYIGALFLDAEIRDVPEAPEDTDDNTYYHEVQFLLLHTSKGDVTLASHNEHNGYYGGFYLNVTEGEATA